MISAFLTHELIPSRHQLKHRPDALRSSDARNDPVMKFHADLLNWNSPFQEIVNDLVFASLDIELEQINMVMVVLRHQRVQVGATHFQLRGRAFARNPRIALGIQRRRHRQRARVRGQRERKVPKLRNFVFRQFHRSHPGRRRIEQHHLAAEPLHQLMLERNVAPYAATIHDASRIEPRGADRPRSDL